MPKPLLLFCLAALLSSAASAQVSHVILTGGPALRSFESLRVEDHDIFWGNFIAATTQRTTHLRQKYGASADVLWIVYRPSYLRRGAEDRVSYVRDVNKTLVPKYRPRIVWISSAAEAIAALNALPDHSIKTFDYFGHSTRHAFMLEYGSEIQGISTAWITLHEEN